MNSQDFAKTEEELSKLMTRHLGVRQNGFAAQISKARRHMPRWAHGAATRINTAITLATHPNLSKHIQPEQLDKDIKSFKAWLQTKDHAEARKTKLINLAGVIVFNLLVIFAVFVAILRWRGLI